MLDRIDIYNGALDNAAGVSQVLAIGRAFAALPEHPRRSILIAFVAAEEQGLLGSAYYAANPTVPAGRMAANINYDGAKQIEGWEAVHYHQPSDEINDEWNFDGMVDDTVLGFKIGLWLAEQDEIPAWNPGDEFEAARQAALAAVGRALRARLRVRLRGPRYGAGRARGGTPDPLGGGHGGHRAFDKRFKRRPYLHLVSIARTRCS